MASAFSAFTYSKKLTVSTTLAGVSSTLSAFPVAVVVNSASWPTSGERTHFFISANSTGKRVQFFASDKTTNLPYEVEFCDGSANASYWVRVPTLTGSSTTDIYVAYGNDPNGADQDAAATVWSNGYLSVWHLGGNDWGSSPQATDSLGSHPLTDTGGTTDGWGVVSHGRVTGAGKYLLGPQVSIANQLANSTIEGWGLWSGGSGESPVYSESSWFRLLVDASTAIPQFGIYSGGWTQVNSSSSVSYGAWYHLAGTLSSTAGMVLYQNGAAAGTNSYTAHAATGINPHPAIGTYSDAPTYYFDNTIDEVRVSNVARSADWIKATYYSCRTTSFPGDGWLTWTAEQAFATAPTVTDSAPTSVTATTATGNGNVTADGGATITERGVCWGTSANPTTAGSHATASGTTGAFTAGMTGLTPGTLYYWRMYATNSVDTTYSTGGSFYTASNYAVITRTSRGLLNLIGA